MALDRDNFEARAARDPVGTLLEAATGTSEQEKRQAEASFWRGFWAKFRSVAARIPFAEDVLAAYFCARDPQTPLRVRATLLGALAYFVLPTDAVPDLLAGFGFTDDAAVVTLALSVVGAHVTLLHRARAKAVLRGDVPPNAPST